MADLEGRVEAILISRAPGQVASQRVEQVEVTFEGFAGDRHAGITSRAGGRSRRYPRGTEIRNTRQVSIVSHEELAEIARRLELEEVLPEWLGANLCLRGIPHLTQLPPGTRLFFSQRAALVVEGENQPCTGPGEVIQAAYPTGVDLDVRFPKAAKGLRGLVGWVERPGQIATGDSLEAVLPAPVMYPG